MFINPGASNRQHSGVPLKRNDEEQFVIDPVFSEAAVIGIIALIVSERSTMKKIVSRLELSL